MATFSWENYNGGYGIPNALSKDGAITGSAVGGASGAAGGMSAGTFPYAEAIKAVTDIGEGIAMKAPPYQYREMFNPNVAPMGLDASMANAYRSKAMSKGKKIGAGTGAAVGIGLGIALAPLTFGLSIPAGAAIGSAVGSMAGGAVGSGIGAKVADKKIQQEQLDANNLRNTWEQQHSDLVTQNNLFNAEQMYKNSLQKNI